MSDETKPGEPTTAQRCEHVFFALGSSAIPARNLSPDEQAACVAACYEEDQLASDYPQRFQAWWSELLESKAAAQRAAEELAAEEKNARLVERLQDQPKPETPARKVTRPNASK